MVTNYKRNTVINFNKVSQIITSISNLLLIILVMFFIMPNVSFAATITWDGGGSTNNWSEAANWSGDTIPTSADVALFNNTSDKDATIDSSFAGSLLGISVASGYDGTITQARSLTIGSSGFGHASGTFVGGSQAIDINAGSFALSGGSFTSTSGVLSVTRSFTVTNNPTFNANNGTVTFDGASSSVGTASCGNITFHRVSIAKGGNETLTVSSNCNLPLGDNPSTTGIIVNNGTINIGTGTWTHSSNYTQNNGSVLSMTGNNIDLNGGSMTLNGGSFSQNITTLAVERSLSNVGNVLPNGIALTMNGTSSATGTLTCGNVTWGSVVISKGGESLTVSSDCTLPLGDNPTVSATIVNNGDWIVGTGTLTVGSNYTQNSGSSITIAGDTLNFNGSMTLNGGIISGNVTNLFVYRTFDNSGNVLPNGLNVTLDGTNSAVGNFNCGSAVLASLVIARGSNEALTITGNCTITGNFTRTSGPINNPGAARTFFIGGNISLSATQSFAGTNLTLELNGTGTQTIAQNSSFTFSLPLRINKSSGQASLSTNLTVDTSACTVVEGAFHLNTRTFSCGGAFTIEDGGTLRLVANETTTTPTLNPGSTVEYKGDGDAAADSYTIKDWSYKNLSIASTDSGDSFSSGVTTVTVEEDFILSQGIFTAPTTLNVAGDFNHSGGIFTHNSGTVVMNGTNQQVLGTTTFNSFTKSVTSEDTLTFDADGVQTFVGTMTLTGQNSELLSIRSTDNGDTADIDPQGTRTISYLDVKDSRNINATLIATAGFNITSSGNNPGWQFNQTPDAPSNLGPAGYMDGSWDNDNTPTMTFDLADDDAGDTVKFRIQIDDDADYSSVIVDYTSALAAQGAFSFTVGQATGGGSYAVGAEAQTLTDSANYYWQVKAIDEDGEESGYNQANGGAVAFKIDTVAPTAGTLSSTGITNSSVTAQVAGASDALSGLAAAPYDFQNITASTSSGAQAGTSWESTGLSVNQQYTFNVVVSDAAGNTATSSDLAVFTAANPPAGLSLVVDSPTQITISWNVNGNPAGTEFFAENIIKGTDSGWVANATSWQSTNLAATTAYNFAVKARNGDNTETAEITGSVQTATPPPIIGYFVLPPNPNHVSHPSGTLVLDGSTVYLIKDGLRYGFRDQQEFESYGYKFSQLVLANQADLSLPLSGGVVKAMEGTLVLDQSDSRTVYMIGTNHTKRGFTSMEVFTVLGYDLEGLAVIDVSDYETGQPIQNPNLPHPDGSLVIDGQTIWWIRGDKKQGFESMLVFDTYGFKLNDVVPANTADLKLDTELLVRLRDGTLVFDQGYYYIIVGGKKNQFESASTLVAHGYNLANVVNYDLSEYRVGNYIR